MPKFKIRIGLSISTSLVILLISSFFVSTTACKREGCTDPLANNYDEKAKENDGTCTYDNNNTLLVRFVPTYKDEELSLDQSYTNDSGRNFRVTLFKFYISDFTLNGNSGNFTEEYIHFVDMEPEPPQREDIPDWTNEFSIEAATGSYNSFSFGLGVRNDENEKYTPNDYPLENPLNVTYNSMGWGWADKYKFVVMEGDYDSNGDGEFDDKFFVHTGFQEMYRIVSFDKNLEVNLGSEATIEIEVDIAEAFKMSPISELKSHSDNASQIDVSTRFTDGLVKGMSLK